MGNVLYQLYDVMYDIKIHLTNYFLFLLMPFKPNQSSETQCMY